MKPTLVDLELDRIDWSGLREACGPATDIPSAIRDLLAASSRDASEKAYWRLENHVVLQESVFEVAAYVVPVLMAALAEERPRPVRIMLLDLLFLILSGGPGSEEEERRVPDLMESCRAAAREGLWLLYRELVHGATDAARDVLEIIETDSARLQSFLSRLNCN